MENKTETATMSLQEKLRKIAEIADAVQKSKEGYGYKYVPEPEVLALITAGLENYRVNLIPHIVPGTLTVTPVHYEKYNKAVKGMAPVNEVIVNGEMIYEFINVDKPEERVEVPWALVAQMEDAAQAFGAALTYANRYALVKVFQIATLDEDPDNYRTKQKMAADKEEIEAQKKATEELNAKIKELVNYATVLIDNGVSKDIIYEIVAKHNEGRKNPNSMTSIDEVEAALTEMKEANPVKTEKKAAKAK